MDNAEMDEFVNLVRERSDIHAVVSRYLQLSFKGGRYWACCPFHEEKTASFTITPEKGLFYCFGCHAGGNVFKFISMIENISYFEAIKLQAERLGIPLPARKKNPQEMQADRERQELLKVMELAQEFYHNSLNQTAGGEAGRKYLAKRGITSGVIEKFKLGFAPDSWDSLTRALKSRGFNERQLLAAGLAVPKKNSSDVYDRLRGRVIIPIADILGRVVAFGGRILNPDNTPKYLNTPETEIFSKGRLLFGLDKANRAISAANCAIVVEGYMDAISLVSAGIENVVATLGTAFTAEHAKLLTRYARRVIFCYDSDEAGQRATIRALPILQNAGAEIFVIVVPEGKDPDEFIRKNGRDAFERLMKNAAPMIDYRLRYILERADTSTLEGKIRALREILPTLANITDAVTQGVYRAKLSNTLLLDEQIILQEWETLAKTDKKPAPGSRNNIPARKEFNAIQQAGATIIKMAWSGSDILPYVLSVVPKEVFTKLHREIISYLEKCNAEERAPDDLSAAAELSEAANVEIARILAIDLSEQMDAAFDDSIRTLKKAELRIKHDKAIKEAEKYFKSGDNSAYIEKMRESLKIKQEMDEL